MSNSTSSLLGGFGVGDDLLGTGTARSQVVRKTCRDFSGAGDEEIRFRVRNVRASLLHTPCP